MSEKRDLSFYVVILLFILLQIAILLPPMKAEEIQKYEYDCAYLDKKRGKIRGVCIHDGNIDYLRQAVMFVAKDGEIIIASTTEGMGYEQKIIRKSPDRKKVEND